MAPPNPIASLLFRGKAITIRRSKTFLPENCLCWNGSLVDAATAPSAPAVWRWPLCWPTASKWHANNWQLCQCAWTLSPADARLLCAHLRLDKCQPSTWLLCQRAASQLLASPSHGATSLSRVWDAHNHWHSARTWLVRQRADPELLASPSAPEQPQGFGTHIFIDIVQALDYCANVRLQSFWPHLLMEQPQGFGTHILYWHRPSTWLLRQRAAPELLASPRHGADARLPVGTGGHGWKALHNILYLGGVAHLQSTCCNVHCVALP